MRQKITIRPPDITDREKLDRIQVFIQDMRTAKLIPGLHDDAQLEELLVRMEGWLPVLKANAWDEQHAEKVASMVEKLSKK